MNKGYLNLTAKTAMQLKVKLFNVPEYFVISFKSRVRWMMYKEKERR
jgi:hypothetical protein